MNLPQLFAQLDQYQAPIPIDQLTALMRDLTLTPEEIAPHINFDPDHYQRNLIHLGQHYAALALCWAAGQRSPIHDHHHSACGVRVISGTAHETQFTRTETGQLIEGQTNTYPETTVCGSFDSDIHEMFNPRNTNPGAPDPDPLIRGLVTLHIYTPHLNDVHVYYRDSTKVDTFTDHETQNAKQKLAGATP